MLELKNFSPNILLIGDLILDVYLWGDCQRISPEAPVQVVDISKEEKVLGGAGNVLSNLISLGANVSFISVLGLDDTAKDLRKILSKYKIVDELLLIENARKTSKKTRVISSNQQILRFDSESKEDISKENQERVMTYLKANIKNFDLLVISDYLKGVLTYKLCQDIIKLAKKFNKKVLIDPKGEDYSKYKGAYLLTPNKKEASLVCNIDIKDDNSLFKASHFLKKEFDLEYSIVTLSEDGISLFDNELLKFPTYVREVYDVTGAGDTVLASLAFCLAIAKDIRFSISFANSAAAVAVSKIGCASVSIDDIITFKSLSQKADFNDFIKDFTSIDEIVKKAKKEGKKIVFTNGCFDILHFGHIKYLEKAKKLGDILIIGLNSDSSVKRLKGNSRPINNVEDRAYILASLSIVDYVVCFDEDTPLNLIKLIRPDVLVKGGDYKAKDVVGTNFALELKLIPFVKGRSTTNLVDKLKGLKDV